MGVEESSFPFAGSLSWSLNALNCAVRIINFPALSTSWPLTWTVSSSLFLARAFSFFTYFMHNATARCAWYQLENRSTLSSTVDLLFSDDNVVMVTDFLTSWSSSLKMWFCSSLLSQVQTLLHRNSGPRIHLESWILKFLIPRDASPVGFCLDSMYRRCFLSVQSCISWRNRQQR